MTFPRWFYGNKMSICLFMAQQRSFRPSAALHTARKQPLPVQLRPEEKEMKSHMNTTTIDTSSAGLW